MKFYIVEHHYSYEQERYRESFTNKRDAIRAAKNTWTEYDSWNWYKEPRVYKVTTTGKKNEVMQIAEGGELSKSAGKWELVWSVYENRYRGETDPTSWLHTIQP